MMFFKIRFIYSGVDYAPGILAMTHHLTESLQNQVNRQAFHNLRNKTQVPMVNIVLECLLLGVLYPLAVPICYGIFILARIRGKVG